MNNPISTYIYNSIAKDRKIPDILICNPSFPLNIDRFIEKNLTQADFGLLADGMIVDDYRGIGGPKIDRIIYDQNAEFSINKTQEIKRMLAGLNYCKNLKLL